MSRTTDMAPDTLFHPFESGMLGWPETGRKIAFLNARPHKALLRFRADIVQQFFKPDADALTRAGLRSGASLPALSPEYDLVLLLLPKNQSEAEYFCACALSCLKEGGTLVAAADNKAGGARIEKMFKVFGLGNAVSLSKHKARVCWATKTILDGGALSAALGRGAPQPVLGGQYHSQPGLFGWDKIDRGSEILLQHLPSDLKGAGADFGCGYGFLSRAIVQKKTASVLHCVDADHRAVEMCRLNVADCESATKTEFVWADLCQPVKLPPLDFIVMNPPFHEGKASDVAIGEAFIRTAHGALKTGGTLWMVANVHLPYEGALQSLFASCEKKFEGAGFKVYAR